MCDGGRRKFRPGARLSRAKFVLEWTITQGKRDAASHIGRVTVSSVVDSGDKPEGETGLRGGGVISDKCG